MKISKLFHWLYAFLMFLPVFFIGSRCFYVILNKNAKDSYYGETINEKQIVQPSSFVVNDNYIIYLPNDSVFTRQSSATDFSVTNVKYDGVDYDINTLRFYVNQNTSVMQIQGYNVPSNGNSFQLSTNTGANHDIEFTFLTKNNSYYLDQILILTKQIEYNEYSYLDNAFEYSINLLNEVQLFSWAQTSFLSAPMVYITGLFGMPSNSPVITLLSYWLSISIVWLVFDLVMYIPLLVHRWIDRGIIE